MEFIPKLKYVKWKHFACVPNKWEYMEKGSVIIIFAYEYELRKHIHTTTHTHTIVRGGQATCGDRWVTIYKGWNTHTQAFTLLLICLNGNERSTPSVRA